MVQVRKFLHSPNKKQFACLKLLYDRETTYPLFGGGAGGGKSWLACEWEAAMCLNFPGVRYFMGREELSRLKDTTVKTFFKMAKHHKIEDTFRYYEHYSSIRFYNGSEISLLNLKYEPSDPMFERLGSTEYTGGLIEEAGEVHFQAFDTLKSRVGRQLNDKYDIPRKLLITCNPKKNWLYHTFYKPWKEGTLEKGYAFIQSLASENEKIDQAYVQSLDEIKDKTLKSRLKYGEWDYDEDPSNLVDFENVLNIRTNAHISPTVEPKCITADIARFGIDTTTVRVWHGLKVVEVKVYKKLSVTDSAAKIRELAVKYSIPMSRVLVDEDGVGGGVVDILRSKGFVNNSSPIFGQNYDNLKSQCAFRIAELISLNQIYEPCEDSLIWAEVEEELQLLKQKNVDSDKKLGLIPKEKMKDLIGRSPNHLDTYIMRGYFEIIKPVRSSASAGAW